MEYLVFAVILYFILQTAGNLVYVLRGGTDPSRPQAESAPMDDWKGPSPRREMEGMSDHPAFWGKDVDDATWTEVDEETG